MIPCSIFQSVEFYVIAAVVATAVLAFLGKRPEQGPVVMYLLPGVLSVEDPGVSPPNIEFECMEDGAVRLRRHGLSGISSSGAVSLAVEKKGFDIRITERVVEGHGPAEDFIDTASFELDFMGRDHYFISYQSAMTSSSSPMVASLTLHNRAGIRVKKNLQ